MSTSRELRRWDARDVEALASEWGVPAVEAWERIGSTNDRGLELAREGVAPWTVVIADEQTRGRGRRGSVWQSDPGAGLWMSVLLPVSPRRPLPLLLGLACAEAVERVAPGLRVGVKWPNDLMVGGAKVGGILCELEGGAVVAGIGINVARTPVEPLDDDGRTSLPATALEIVHGKPLRRSVLAREIIARSKVRFADGAPVEDALRALGERDVLAGRPVDTDHAGPGVAVGIDPEGALLLRLRTGREVRVVAGGVRLSRPYLP